MFKSETVSFLLSPFLRNRDGKRPQILFSEVTDGETEKKGTRRSYFPRVPLGGGQTLLGPVPPGRGYCLLADYCAVRVCAVCDLRGVEGLMPV